MSSALEQYDPQIYELIRQEEARQSGSIRLIPSENYVSKAVMAATGSCLTNKYSEGYPGKRYYEGQQVTDLIETLATERAKLIFKADHANVQPYSGSVANLAAYNALIKPGDTIMGLALNAGGHLTHGSKHSMTSKYFRSVSYGVDPSTGLLDYNMIEDLAKKYKPSLIISGTTAYSRSIDFEIFGQIAKNVGAYHVSDIAHISGLVVAGLHKSPVPYADIVSTTTHKTLRGPRGGMLLCKMEHAQKVDRAIIPGQQGGPHMHTIAAIAVALAEANTEEFILYAKQIIKNAKRLAEKLIEAGFDVVTGGTDTHLMLVDLRPKKLTGKAAEASLENASITCNKNGVPFDPEKPMVTSGVRLGSPAATSRGFGVAEFTEVGNMIGDVLDGLAANPDDNSKVEGDVHARVQELCGRFPIYNEAL